MSAAVCQKNVGEGYLPLVYQGLGLSPGRVTKISASRIDSEAGRRRSRQSTKAYKRRRLDLKQQNYSSSGQKELREGVTYQSSIGLECGGLAQSDTISIPSMVSQPEVCRIPQTDLLDVQLIIFDLETTALGDSCEITQLAASTMDKTRTFDQYVLPDGTIPSKASSITSITKERDTLFYKGRPVPSVDTVTALQRFAEWLENCGKSVLIAHNAEKFDSRHLWRIIRSCKLEGSFSSLVGFGDSLPLFRAKFPNEKNHKLGGIHNTLLGKPFVAHNALDDVFALIDILQVIQLNNTSLAEYTFARKYINDRFEFLILKQNNLATLQTLVAQKVLSSGMAEKMAASGLNFSHLEIVFQRGGVDGLKDLCTEKFGGKCRVTSDKRILTALSSYFENVQPSDC